MFFYFSNLLIFIYNRIFKISEKNICDEISGLSGRARASSTRPGPAAAHVPSEAPAADPTTNTRAAVPAEQRNPSRRTRKTTFTLPTSGESMQAK
jgi:hypothetical protein